MEGDNKIVEFDSVIYPFKLWVSITNDLNDICGTFIDFYTKYGLTKKFSPNQIAFTQVVERISDDFLGILIVIQNKDDCTTQIMAHEATHAVRDIWEILNECSVGKEADAYLVGWVVKCIESVKNEMV